MAKFRLFLFTLVLALLLTTPALAASSTGARAAWDLTSSGSVSCELTLTHTFQTPEDTFSLTLPKGAEKITVYNYSSKRKGETVTILPGTTFIGQQTFRLSYTLPGAVQTVEGTQILTLPLIPEGCPVEVDYVEFSLNLPKNYKNEPVLTIGDYRTLEAVYTLDDDRIAGSLLASIPAGRGLTLTMDLGSQYIKTRYGTLTSSSAVWRVLLTVLVLLAAAYWYLFFFRRTRLPKVTARALNPDGAEAVDLPCLLYGGSGDTAALLTEWAGLGYVEFLRERNGRYVVHKLMNMGSERRSFERRLFSRIFAAGSMTRVGGAHWNLITEDAGKRLQKHWARKLFDPRSGSPKVLQGLCALFGTLSLVSGAANLGILPAILALPVGLALSLAVQRGTLALLRRSDRTELLIGCGAAAVLLVLLFVLSDPLLLVVLAVEILCGLALCWGGRRTAFGTDLLEQTLGYRKHLLELNDKKRSRALGRDSQFFYRTLPYAEALGCGKAFADGFDKIRMEPCDWLDLGVKSGDAFYVEYAALIRQLRPEKQKKPKKHK